MNREAWRPVVGFEGYEVSDSGNVRSLPRRNSLGYPRRGRVLKPGRYAGGYRAVHLAKGGVKTPKSVHCLVLEAFVSTRPEGQQARHKNGVRDDNRLDNLQWGTVKENAADRVAHGTAPVGAKNPRAILTEVDVERIRDLTRAGVTQEVIGAWLGFSRSSVSHVLNNRQYLSI